MTGFTFEGFFELASSGPSFTALEPEPISSAQLAPLPESEATNREARALLGEWLGVEIDPDNPDFLFQVSLRLDDIGVQRCRGELVQPAEALFIGGVSPGDMSLYLLQYAVYFASNNLLSFYKLNSLLQWVIRSEKFSIVERLIVTKMPSVEIFAVKLLVSAARLDNFSVACTLIKRGVDVDGFVVVPPGVKTTALREAVQRRNPALVRLLLDAGANPNTRDERCEDGRTVLRAAITGFSHSLEIAEMLIERGANVNTHTVINGETRTLLNEAVADGNINAVRLLLAAGARVNDARDETAFQIAALRNNSEMIELLLDAGADVHCPAGKAYAGHCQKAAREGRYGFFRTPLQRAVSQDNVEICQLMLDAGADVNGFPAANCAGWIRLAGNNEGRPGSNRNDEDMMIYEKQDGDYDDGNDSNNYYDINGDRRMCTPLQEAVLQNSIILVRLLLFLGADVNAVGSHGTALQIATREPKGCKIARLLLSKGADVNSPAQVPGPRTALQEAALSGNQEMVELLLNQGAQVNATPSRHGGRTALQAAVEAGRMDLVKLLVSAGADVNAPAAPENGRTCLQAAAELGNMELLNYLLRLGADVNGPPSLLGGRTALQAAVERKRVAIVKRLLEVGADVRARPSRKDGLQPLCAALSNTGCYELPPLLLANGADPNEGCYASRPLDIAAKDGDVAMVGSLILAGADVNRRRPVDGVTALAIAASHDRTNTVIMLIEVGGATLYGIDGTRALESAVENDSITIVRLLLAKGVCPNRPAYAYATHKSALYRAATRSVINNDMLHLLLNYGADVRTDGGSCLQAVARAGSRNAVQLLLAAGADVNFPALEIWNGNPGYTALQAAVLSGDMDVVHILLDAGADINGPPGDARGETALQAAVGLGDKNMVEFLLSRGADVNGPPSKSYGGTALQRAVIVGHLGIALVLLEAGADINAPAAAEGGRTALEVAAEHGRLDLACLLLQNEDDADTEAVRMRCKRAVDLAFSNGHVVLGRILKDWSTG
jgi:ankyrin repeat protein